MGRILECHQQRLPLAHSSRRTAQLLSPVTGTEITPEKNMNYTENAPTKNNDSGIQKISNLERHASRYPHFTISQFIQT